MGGGLIQLVAYGAQDIFLTGNPQITFFKVVYRRHTNFSIESVKQTFNSGETLEGSTSLANLTVSRTGDLLHKIYVRIDQDSTKGISGDRLISKVDLEIGGQLMDRHYQEWNQIYAELTTPASKTDGHKYMTGGFTNKLGESRQNDDVTYNSGTRQQSIIIPLNFWFCKNAGLALPLVALQYHDVKLNFTWGSATATDGSGVGRDHQAATPTCDVLCDYIYLDTDERRRFAQVSHEYLIDQVQRQVFGTAAERFNLKFNHPVKELIWTTDSHYGIADTATVVNQKTRLQLNGHDRFSEQDREYFQIRQPLDHHTSVPGFNIKETDDPVMIAPIDVGVTKLHETTASDGKAVLVEPADATEPVTQLKLHSAQADTDEADDGDDPTSSAIKVGDILSINISPEPNGATLSELNLINYFVQIKKVTRSGDILTYTFTNSLLSNYVPSLEGFFNNHGVSIHIIGRTQNPRSRCSSLHRDINCYSFALKPEEHQPSGTCNFSRIDNAELVLSSSGTIQNVYAVNYNVLRVMSGMAGLAYSI